MLTIAVCDDNIQFAKRLVSKIRSLCATLIPERIFCQVIMEFTSANDVIQYLSQDTISILFLDIDMPQCNGFKLASHLNKSHPDIIIIFVSAYDNFVYESFDYSPFSFLRKRYLENYLPSALEKAIEKYIFSFDTIDFVSTEGTVSIRIKDIIYFESQKNYYNIFCSDKVYKCRGTINQVEEKMRAFDFYRIHSAYVINLDNIEKLSHNNLIIMKNGDILNISQRRYSEFKNSYTKFTRKRFIK